MARKPEVTESALASVFASILTGKERDDAVRYRSLLESGAADEARAAIARADIDGFSRALTSPLADAVDVLLLRALPDSHAARFLFGQKQFVERHLRWVFVQFEGMACCADKMRTVMRALARSLVLGERIEFDYGGQYTYHLPRAVLVTHDEIHGFLNALNRLFYGNPEAYLQWIAAFTGRMRQDGGQADPSSAESSPA